MAEYVLFTDSTTDLPVELVQEMQVEVMPLVFTLGGKNYRNYPDNRELSPKEFYDRLRAGEVSTTSQINQADFLDAFTPVLEQGKDILYLAFPAGFPAPSTRPGWPLRICGNSSRNAPSR